MTTSTSPARLARPTEGPRRRPSVDGARYTLRAMRWQALVAGAALGAAMIGLSHLIEGGLLGSVHLGIAYGTMATAIGVAFVLDDPAATTLAPVPVTLRRRTTLRMALGLLLLALTLGGFATLAWEPLAHLATAGQAAGLATVGIAGSAVAGRLAGWRRPGAAGAAAVTAFVVADALEFLPGEALLTGGAPVTHSAATVATWTVLAAGGLAATGWMTGDPTSASRRLAPRRPSRRTEVR